ncbi:MAG: 50S ribosomal protein L17 [Deltaproteobacteria bacterium]|nr:MAG: 50S ribosomal protein L17 [Deltaproteobacteria bacterium]
MRHQKAGKKLNRTESHRSAMFRNMVTSLFAYGRVRTTNAKAKELRRWADRMITLAKRGDLHARRQAMAVIRDKNVVHKLFEDAPGRFGDREGGYTHVAMIGRRLGDGAPMSLVELVGKKEKKKPAAKKVAEKIKKHVKSDKQKAKEATKKAPSELEGKDLSPKTAPASLEQADKAKGGQGQDKPGSES